MSFADLLLKPSVRETTFHKRILLCLLPSRRRFDSGIVSISLVFTSRNLWFCLLQQANNRKIFLRQRQIRLISQKICNSIG